MKGLFGITDICEKIIGHINAVGETCHDEESCDNLGIVYSLIYFYLEQLLKNEKRMNAPEYSVKKVAENSNKILNEYRNMLSS
ncbi:MAG: hypothetical protein K0R54_1836 [Clostridiaceae bacterium]|nr:hypothetical protein [Clostridiaceae bacterium]